MNLGLAFMALLLARCRGSEDESFNASLRRHYPHQVRRVCSHPAASSARTPTLLEKSYSKEHALASRSPSGAHGEHDPDAVALAFAAVAGVARERSNELQAEASDRLMGDQRGGVVRPEFAERIVRWSRVLVDQGEAAIFRLESHPDGRLTLLAISVGYGVRE